MFFCLTLNTNDIKGLFSHPTPLIDNNIKSLTTHTEVKSKSHTVNVQFPLLQTLLAAAAIICLTSDAERVFRTGEKSPLASQGISKHFLGSQPPPGDPH